MKRLTRVVPLFVFFLSCSNLMRAQAIADTTSGEFTLEQCLSYALENKPEVQQAQIDEAIGEREIRANLSAWLPQISAQYNASHNFKLQTAAFGDQLITLGRKNNSNILLQADQVIYSRDVLLASKAARFTRNQLDQNTEESKINTVVNVSKAFYDILLTQEQLSILEENIVRQEKQYKDARSQYQSGLVDKTDYQRASITLANTRSDRKRTQESLTAKHAALKELMGYPVDKHIDLVYEYGLMEQDIQMDTTQELVYTNRIEYQQLQTQSKLLQLNTSYYQWDFLPTVSAFANYNWIYLNDEMAELYDTAYPTSAAGLQVNLPIFQGTRRIQNLQIAQLQEERQDIGMADARRMINTEYERALANYKSDYNEWLTLQENVEVAEEVYDIIKLQYDEGIRAYLDLIVAETDLRTAQINYYNALYNALASKLDYQKALGNIDFN
ncbi:TolC family protein [Catalinimonas niigatensis]|uniref:TolC family protein n=1 Tax=Catalinimonas niigatensis TaxID=1397264 RepID=UPI002666B67A|nr:TolC family protein [Catalinimonas niigatensis]WPP52105.1 TolC family protein [Catalinimonas niigatensis]